MDAKECKVKNSILSCLRGRFLQNYRMGDQPTEETQFVVDEVSNVIKEAIETTIGGNSYMVWRHALLISLSALITPALLLFVSFRSAQHAKVNQWTNGVVESCLAR